MTFPSTASNQTYTGDGSTTAYSIPFPYHDKTYIKATIDKTVTTAFSVTDGSAQDGHIANGTLTFNTAPAASAAIVIYCETPIAQQSIDQDASNSMDVEDVEHALDYQVAVVRDLDRKVDNAQDLATDSLRTELQDLVDDATDARDAAQTSETNSSNSETAAAGYASSAQAYRDAAQTSANNASDSADAASTSAGQASAIASGTLHTYTSISPGTTNVIAGGDYEMGANGDGTYNLQLPTPSAAILIRLFVTSDGVNVNLLRAGTETINLFADDITFSGAGFYTVAVYDSSNWACVKGELDGIYAQTQAGPQGPAGADGADGTNGTDGADGATLRHGSGVPAGGLGSDGDYYMDTASGQYYAKSGGSWSSIVNLTGPQGATGPTGPTGPQGPAGADGADGADGTGLTTGNKGDVTVNTESDWDLNSSSNVLSIIRAATLTGLSTATATVITAADSILTALGKLQGQVSADYTTLTNHVGSSSNPHSVTKAQVGLTNVPNTDATNASNISSGTLSDARLDTQTRTRVIQFIPVDFETELTTGDGKFYFHVPASLNGMDIVSAHAEVITAGTTGTTDFQLHNVTSGQDIFSTKLTIDSGETGSDTAATPVVINTAQDDLTTNDLLRLDIDAVSTTAPQGAIVTLEVRKP